MTERDPLTEFLHWFLKNGTVIGAVPLLNAVHRIEDVWSVTWLRSPPFQVQLFVVPPNTIIPEHTHPNVDSYEIYIGGQIKFSHSGKFVVSDEAFTVPGFNGVSQSRGQIVRVKPNDLHGGVFGESGGVFMSVQHWLNDVEPHCVAADYTGTVMGPGHMAQVKCGEPQLKATLAAKDAAHLETTE